MRNPGKIHLGIIKQSAFVQGRGNQKTGVHTPSMTMTNEQKSRHYGGVDVGTPAIAQELGLTKSAISNYCRGNGLGSMIVHRFIQIRQRY